MSESYTCCFCGDAISTEHSDALQLIATNLWKRKIAQPLHAHAICASQHITKGDLSPDYLRDEETAGFTLQELVWGDHEAGRVPWWGCVAALAVIALGAYLIFG